MLAAYVPGQKDQAKSSAAPATLEIWHPWDGTREPLFKQVTGAFQQKYTHVTVIPTVVTAR